MMAPYHYLNKLFVDKFSSGSKRKRSASVTISQVACSDCPASSNSIINLRTTNNNNNQTNQNNSQINRDNKQQQQQQQQLLAAANKENLEPDDESAACLTFKQQAVLEETSNRKEGEAEAEEEEHQEQQRLKRKVLTSNDLTNTLKSTCSSSRRLIMIRKQQQQQQQQQFHNQHYRQAAANQFKSRRNHLLRSKQLQQRQQQCKSGATHNKTLFAILDNNMSCPTILYLAALVAVVMFSSHNLHQIDCATLGPEANGTYLSQSPASQPQPQSSSSSSSSSSSFSLFNRENSRSPPMTFPPVLSSIDWHRIGSSLQKQFESIRWPSPHASRIGAGSSSGGGVGGSGGGTRDPARLSPLRRRPSPLVRAFDRIRSQMGARNTIRVHNAFRDFAWRVLSSLSMPTPVIYELRRQNFYSPEEDLINDNFYNRNTSRTIRSKRLIDPAKVSNWLSTTTQHALRAAGRGDSLNAGAAAGPSAAVQKTHRRRRRRRRSASGDDDDEPETLRERLRMRLDDLLSLSRRSLFGRVVRLPSLFPFKRQEDEDDSDSDDRSDKATAQLAVAAAAVAKSTTGATSQGAKQRQLTSGGGGGGGGSSKRQSGIRLLTMAGRSGRKRKEADRQMISINGKQYYVDDDGELKEWTEQT